MNQYTVATVAAQPLARNFSSPSSVKSSHHTRIDGDWQEHWQARLTPKAFSAFIHLRKRQGKNEAAFPSHEAIAAATNMSVSSVKRDLKELADVGLLSWSQRTQTTKKGAQRQTSNLYFLARCDLPSPVTLDDAPRSQRATKQSHKVKVIKPEQTPASPVKASPVEVSQCESVEATPEQAQYIEAQLRDMDALNKTTLTYALAAPAEALFQLPRLREAIAHRRVRETNGAWFIYNLTNKRGHEPRKGAAKPQAPADGPRYVSEADLVAEREQRNEPKPSEPVAPLLRQLLAQPPAVNADSRPASPSVDEEQLARDKAAWAAYEALPTEQQGDIRQQAARGLERSASNYNTLWRRATCALMWREHGALVERAFAELDL